VINSSIWKWFTTQGQEQEAAYAAAVEQLRILEGELDGKRFFAGDRMGLVDLSLGPFSYVIPVYEEITGVKMVAEETFPSLFAWMAGFLSSSSVVKDHLPPLDDLKPRYQAIREAFLKNTN
jgi:glutathione S-transferase